MVSNQSMSSPPPEAAALSPDQREAALRELVVFIDGQHRDTLTRFEESYMSTKATAARIYEYGEPDVFRFETTDVPDPVGHEVLVRNTVIGLNFVDIYYRRGTLPVPEFPAIIGDEASGVVEAVGPNGDAGEGWGQGRLRR